MGSDRMSESPVVNENKIFAGIIYGEDFVFVHVFILSDIRVRCRILH